jgi:hypothetical protein
MSVHIEWASAEHSSVAVLTGDEAGQGLPPYEEVDAAFVLLIQTLDGDGMAFEGTLDEFSRHATAINDKIEAARRAAA